MILICCSCDLQDRVDIGLAGRDEDDPRDPAYWNKFLAEGPTPFEPAPEHKPTIETLRSLYAAVLVNYQYRCAMTGRQFTPPEALLHEDLKITPIRPLPLGGPLHVSNFLCLAPEADTAFRAGHITIGPQCELVVDLSRIDPELVEVLNPIGRLRLPEAEIGQPDPAALRFHRERIFLNNSPGPF